MNEENLPSGKNSAELAKAHSSQDPQKADQSLQPENLKDISDLVLLVDTTSNDELESLLIPDIATVGQVLYHNNALTYEDSLKCFFDNAHKFNNPLNITLKFKLGLQDDGSSMNDLLLKANGIKSKGNFKFKIHIFKVVTHQTPDSFKMPPLELFKDLNCISFRFDTDLIPRVPFKSRTEQAIAYHKNVDHHIPISISWLGEDLEELHLGQKVRLLGKSYVDLVFPKLVNVGFECYDLVRFENPLDTAHMVGLLWSAKEIHLYGTAIEYYFDWAKTDELPVTTKTIYYSCNAEWPSEIAQDSLEKLREISKLYSIDLIEVPFLPEHQTASKNNQLRFHLLNYTKIVDFDDVE